MLKSITGVSLLLLVCVVAGVLILSRPKPAEEAESHAVLNQVLQQLQTSDGQRMFENLYAQECATCHGVNMEGGSGVPSLKGGRLTQDGAGLFIAQRIYEGGVGMPAFKQKLSKPEILGLSLWLLDALQQSAPAKAASPATWKIHGTLHVGALADQYPRGQIFLFAKRDSNFAGPPLLVKKIPLTKVIEFQLGPENVMAGAPPSTGTKVYLRARLDVDGNPMTRDQEPETKIIEVVLQTDAPRLQLDFK